MIVKLLTEYHLEFLSLKGGCRGSSESTLVKMPHCWKSHATAHYAFSAAISFTLEWGLVLEGGVSQTGASALLGSHHDTSHLSLVAVDCHFHQKESVMRLGLGFWDTADLGLGF